tara:strand:+ start:677 stop:871 length:195 start_codon:yes stop_codon:yes gene_type:complete
MFFKTEIAAVVASTPLFFLNEDLSVACFLFKLVIIPNPIGHSYFIDKYEIDLIIELDKREKCGV